MTAKFITGYNNVGKTFYLFNRMVDLMLQGKTCVLVNTLPRSYEAYNYVEALVTAHLTYAYETRRGRMVDLFALQETAAENNMTMQAKLDLCLNTQEKLIICNNVELLDLYPVESGAIFFTDECLEPALAHSDIQHALNFAKQAGSWDIFVDFNGLASTDFFGVTGDTAVDLFVSSSQRPGFVDIENIFTRERTSHQLHVIGVYGQ